MLSGVGSSIKGAVKKHSERLEKTRAYEKKYGPRFVILDGDHPLGASTKYTHEAKRLKNIGIRIGKTTILSPQAHDGSAEYSKDGLGQWIRNKPIWEVEEGKEHFIRIWRRVDGKILVKGMAKGSGNIRFKDPELDKRFPKLIPVHEMIPFFIW